MPQRPQRLRWPIAAASFSFFSPSLSLALERHKGHDRLRQSLSLSLSLSPCFSSLRFPPRPRCFPPSGGSAAKGRRALARAPASRFARSFRSRRRRDCPCSLAQQTQTVALLRAATASVLTRTHNTHTHTTHTAHTAHTHTLKQSQHITHYTHAHTHTRHRSPLLSSPQRSAQGHPSCSPAPQPLPPLTIRFRPRRHR